jgi:hypothetical protein
MVALERSLCILASRSYFLKEFCNRTSDMLGDKSVSEQGVQRMQIRSVFREVCL